MADKPDFIVDPSGNARDVRGQKHSQGTNGSSQTSGAGPSGSSTDFHSYTPSSQRVQSAPRVIFIPIGLILTLIMALIIRLSSGSGGKATYSQTGASALNAGISYYNDGDYDKAILHFNMVIASEPEPGEAYNNLGLAYNAKGENEKAIAEFNQAIQRMPNPATPYSNRGGVYLSMGNHDQAIADFDKAIELDPKLGKAYYNRGVAYLDLGNYDKAIPDFDQAIELAPEQTIVMQVTMEAMLSTRESPLTRGLMNDLKSTETYADLPRTYASRAIAYYEKGDYEGAMADMQRARELGLDPYSASQIETFFDSTGIEPGAGQTEWTPNQENAFPEIENNAGAGAIWMSNGLAGRRVNALAVDTASPANVYAGTDRGLFKSTDSGVSWNATGLSGTSLNLLVIDPATPTTLYAATDSGTLKSLDGGESWSETGLGNVHTLLIDPVTPTSLYAATGRGVFESTDSGESWSVVITNMNNDPTGFVVPITLFAIDPLTPTTLYVGTESYTHPQTWRYYPGSVFKSVDGGGNWSQITSDYNDMNVLTIDPVTPMNIYIGKMGGVLKSMDGGDTWEVINHGLNCSTVYDLLIDPLTPSTLYIATNCGLLKSIDGGQNWKVLDLDLSNTLLLSLAIDPVTSNILYVGTENGVIVIHQGDIK